MKRIDLLAVVLLFTTAGASVATTGQPGLSEVTLAEKNRKMLLKDARTSSVSRP